MGGSGAGAQMGAPRVSNSLKNESIFHGGRVLPGGTGLKVRVEEVTESIKDFRRELFFPTLQFMVKLSHFILKLSL